MRGVPRHKTKFLKTPSRYEFDEQDQKELQEIELEMMPAKEPLPLPKKKAPLPKKPAKGKPSKKKPARKKPVKKKTVKKKPLKKRRRSKK